jgi:hypothetical protein
MTYSGALEEVLLSHKEIFREGLGTIKGLSENPQANSKYIYALFHEGKG